MEFPKITITSELASPPSFEWDVQLIEYREDPLTRVPCRINAERASRLKQAQRVADLSEVLGKPEDCPFCPQNIEQMTPLFPESLYPRGRIKRDECYFFPNLFPLAEYHAAATLTTKHFLELGQFQARMIADTLIATKEYVLAVYRRNGEARYPIYLWNHLPPSAASIVHPHIQVLVDRRPTPYQQTLLQSSLDYFQKTGKNFWREIVEEEKRIGERYIGGNDRISVLASYAPQGNREVQIIFKDVSNLAELDELQIGDFADCVIRILSGYEQMGVGSFNLSTFSGPMGEKLDYYFLNAKIISRPLPQPFYRNDTGILERFHYEADIEMLPEVVAQTMKAFFE
jgi:galactose-1-phosphate uridylyltransferase